MEYNMQPIVREEINAVALVRQIAVDFINMDVDGRYPIEWETDEELIVCRMRVLIPSKPICAWVFLQTADIMISARILCVNAVLPK